MNNALIYKGNTFATLEYGTTGLVNIVNIKGFVDTKYGQYFLQRFQIIDEEQVLDYMLYTRDGETIDITFKISFNGDVTIFD